jgi:hypothetical protein
MSKFTNHVFLALILIKLTVVLLCLSGCKTTNDHLIEQSLIKMRQDHHQEQMDKQHRRDMETIMVSSLAKVAVNSQDTSLKRKYRPKIMPNDDEPIDSGYITLGSSKQDVIVTHGTPKSINKIVDNYEVWLYKDYSRIVFINNLVSQWENNGYLKVRMG